MKKIILLLGIVLFLTGCDANYKVEISSDYAKETTTIRTTTKSNEQYSGMPLTDFLETQLNSNIPSYFNPNNYDELNGNRQPNVAYYNLRKFSNSNFYELEASYDFSLNMLYRSRAIKECFDEINIQKNETLYRITTNAKCKAFENYPLLENLKIEIVSDYDVIYNNADEVNGTSYIWYLTKYTSNKSLNFVFNTKTTDLSDFDPFNTDKPEEKEESWINTHKWTVVFVCFLGFIITILGVLWWNSKKIHSEYSK